MTTGKPERYADAPQEIRDAVEQLIKTYGSDPALLAGAIVSATSRAILAAKAEEREACAQRINDRAEEFRAGKTVTSNTMARIFDDMAHEIRKRGEG
jgi:hypothetical protein